MIREPALPEEEWQREREVIYAEMAMIEDNPEEWIMDRHFAALFPDHALGKPVLGTHEALASFSSDDLSEYLQYWYRPPGLLITAAGRIDHADLITEIASLDWVHNGKISGQPVLARRYCKMQTGIQPLEREGEQAQLVLSFPGIEVTSAERPLAWLANQMLGGGMSSCLFREIREKRGLAYGVGSHLSMLTDMGTWSVTCGMDPSRGAECVAVLCDVLGSFVEEMKEEELLRAKRQMEVQFRMGLDSVEGQMLYLASRLDEKKLSSPMQWLELIRSVDMDQLRQWSAKQLSQGILWSVAAPKQALSDICDSIGPVNTH
jgi:predicted Zn-dependent peptidase